MEKERYFDVNTIWEMNNFDTVLSAISTRVKQKRINKKQFGKLVHEYLMDRGIKQYEGEKCIIYYREIDDMYEDYVKHCKINNDTYLNKKDFFHVYVKKIYNEAVKDLNERR